MTWTIDYISEPGIVFSKMWETEEDTWVEIYDWCNEEFNANDWDFWYERTNANIGMLIIHFEFMQEYDAVQFQLRWG